MKTLLLRSIELGGVHLGSLDHWDHLARKRDQIGKYLVLHLFGDLQSRIEATADNHVGPSVINSMNNAIPAR